MPRTVSHQHILTQFLCQYLVYSDGLSLEVRIVKYEVGVNFLSNRRSGVRKAP